MKFCDSCREPATRTAVSVDRDGQKTTKHYCYVHAVQAGTMDVDLDLANAAATKAGFAVNAVVFVVESLLRDQCLIEIQADTGMALTIAPDKTALEICNCISQAAVERFQQQAGLV